VLVCLSFLVLPAALSASVPFSERAFHGSQNRPGRVESGVRAGKSITVEDRLAREEVERFNQNTGRKSENEFYRWLAVILIPALFVLVISMLRTVTM
jgi:hypothetical protein